MKKNTKIAYRIGDPMTKGTFESFIRHFPNGWLRRAGQILGDSSRSLERPTFYAVAHGLIEVGGFETGENFRLSQTAIADITGVSVKSVRRVLVLLERSGAIQVMEVSKRPGGGTPVKNYRLVYSSSVHEVLTVKDRDRDSEMWKRPPREKSGEEAPGTTTPVHPVSQPHAVGTTTPPSRYHNPTIGMSMNESTNVSSDESSPHANVAHPSGRDGVEEEWNLENDPALDQLLADL